MIEVKDLTFSYDKKPFIEKMNFSAKSGEIFGSWVLRRGKDHCPEDYDWIDNELSGKRPGEWNGVQEPDAGIL